MRHRDLTEQMVIRMTEEMRDALVEDSEANERTVAQTVRLACKQYLQRHGGTEG